MCSGVQNSETTCKTFDTWKNLNVFDFEGLMNNKYLRFCPLKMLGLESKESLSHY